MERKMEDCWLGRTQDTPNSGGAWYLCHEVARFESVWNASTNNSVLWELIEDLFGEDVSLSCTTTDIRRKLIKRCPAVPYNKKDRDVWWSNEFLVHLKAIVKENMHV